MKVLFSITTNVNRHVQVFYWDFYLSLFSFDMFTNVF